MSSSTLATTLVCTSSHAFVSASSTGKTLPANESPPLMLSKKAPPRIAIPAATAARALKSMEQAGLPVITPKGLRDAAAEKVGRWSEEEHHVFLEGLEQHGKQWKVIAGLIGTRTVVQVRTHAQKFFQRMDRASKPPAKRKMSLPASLPSRSNKKTRTSPSKKTKRASSLSLVPTADSPIPHYEL
jgi:SHAQKYF class myb-like DNA-binding protein